MASDENMTFQSSLQDEDFDDDIVNYGYDHNHHHQHPHHPHNLSRPSVCTSSTLCGVDGDKNHDDVDNAMTMYVSRLSIENFEVEEGDADGEFSDGSESENELGSSYSLPAMPPRRRNHGRLKTQKLIPVKDYASDYEAQKSVLMGEKTKKEDSWRTSKSRRNKKEKWVFDGATYNWEKNGDENKKTEYDNLNEGFGGESDESGGGNTGVRVITKPKGGRRTLCMDLEEVKACRDLGFELEHEVILEMPCSSRLSVDTTSSGGNSSISNWRISTPGDDPREVKARLKVWARAVALASACKFGT